jgi:hypothetical protein
MKRSEFQRSPAQYALGAERTRWPLHRLRVAATFARRPAHRKRGAAIDTVDGCDQMGLSPYGDRATRYLRSVLAVRPIGSEGLAK